MLDQFEDLPPAEICQGSPPGQSKNQRNGSSVAKDPSKRGDMKMARAKALAAKVARKALKVDLGDGWTTYPDEPPGVGWVVAHKGHPKRYYRDKERAVANWEEQRRQWEQERPNA